MQELSLHLLDLAQNAVMARARTVRLGVYIDTGRCRLRLCVQDDGRGMRRGALAAAADPFYTTRAACAVGLGLPLFAQVMRAGGGGMYLASRPGAGTRVRGWCRPRQVDVPPLGDLGATLLALVCSGRPLRVCCTVRVDGSCLCFDSARHADAAAAALAFGGAVQRILPPCQRTK